MRQKTWWGITLAVYVLFIFSNSMQTADTSSGQSMLVLELAQRGLAAIGLGNVGITEHIIRKTAHFTEYTLLGMLLWQNIRIRTAVRREQIVWTVLFGLGAPFLDETIQLFVEGRSGQISDVWLDMSGVACGVLLCCLCIRLAYRKKRKDSDGKKL